METRVSLLRKEYERAENEKRAEVERIRFESSRTIEELQNRLNEQNRKIAAIKVETEMVKRLYPKTSNY